MIDIETRLKAAEERNAQLLDFIGRLTGEATRLEGRIREAEAERDDAIARRPPRERDLVAEERDAAVSALDATRAVLRRLLGTACRPTRGVRLCQMYDEAVDAARDLLAQP